MNPGESAHEETLCPKRVWVLTMFSDDEALDESGTIPQGLQFHLNRCASCRDLADRLRVVVDGLREVATVQPTATLAAEADLRTLLALRDGAVLTGRVTIPEDDIPFDSHARPRWHQFGRFAAAAAIVLLVSTIGVVQWGHTVASRPDQQADRGRWGDPRPPRSVAPSGAMVSADGGGATDDPPAICIHLTHEDAAMCDKPHARHTATVIRPIAGSGAWGSTGSAAVAAYPGRE